MRKRLDVLKTGAKTKTKPTNTNTNQNQQNQKNKTNPKPGERQWNYALEHAVDTILR